LYHITVNPNFGANDILSEKGHSRATPLVRAVLDADLETEEKMNSESSTSGNTNNSSTPSPSAGETPSVEEFSVTGETVLAKVHELIREGNIRRIVLKNEEGNTIVEFPLTAGVVGAMFLPAFAALGAIAALMANLTIVVERKPETPTSE